MKVICEGLDLSDAILKVSKALGTKKANQILEGIKLTAKGDDLILMATDTELTIEKTIQANVIMEGETVVPGKYFMDFVKKLENEQIELSVLDEGQLKIKYADAESEMQVYNAEEFPKINKEIKENFFLLSQGEFKDLIAKTSFSCSQDDSRPILKGCLFEVENGTVTSVALDGFRMAVCKKQAKAVSGDFKAIIPARTLNEITRLLEKEEEELNVVLQKNTLTFSSERIFKYSERYFALNAMERSFPFSAMEIFSLTVPISDFAVTFRNFSFTSIFTKLSRSERLRMAARSTLFKS